MRPEIAQIVKVTKIATLKVHTRVCENDLNRIFQTQASNMYFRNAPLRLRRHVNQCVWLELPYHVYVDHSAIRYRTKQGKEG